MELFSGYYCRSEKVLTLNNGRSWYSIDESGHKKRLNSVIKKIMRRVDYPSFECGDNTLSINVQNCVFKKLKADKEIKEILIKNGGIVE